MTLLKKVNHHTTETVELVMIELLKSFTVQTAIITGGACEEFSGHFAFV